MRPRDMNFWVRAVAQHEPAHLAVRWNATTRVVGLRCGAAPAPGGEVIPYDRARQLAVHVCVRCSGFPVRSPI
jgi:hypothetical protein